MKPNEPAHMIPALDFFPEVEWRNADRRGRVTQLLFRYCDARDELMRIEAEWRRVFEAAGYGRISIDELMTDLRKTKLTNGQ